MKVLKWASISIGIIIAVLLVGLAAFWISIPPYDREFQFSEDPRDGRGEAHIRPVRWITGTDDNELEIEFRVGEEGISENGGIRVNFGHVLEYDGKRHMYVPFSITAVSAIFFDIDLYREAKVETNSHAELKVKPPSARKAFRKILGLIKYKRSAEGKNNPDNYLRSIDREYGLEIKVARGELMPGETVRIRMGNKAEGKGLRAPHRATCSK